MRYLLLLAAAFLVAFGIPWLQANADEPPAAQTVTVTRVVPRAQTYQHRSAKWWAHRAVRNRREIIRLKRQWRPTVNYAISVACNVYAVSCWQMHRVASCESGHDPGATNGQYRGVFQEGPMFERGPFSRLGSVYDPLLNALTAARTVAREGWSQWECKP